MIRRSITSFLLALSCAVASAKSPQWPAPVAPAVREADGFIVIPNAAIPPSKSHLYKAIFDSTQAASDPKQIVPALNMLGAELNAMAAAGISPKNVKFVIVFHGAATNGILAEDAYKARFGVSNPNLPVLAKLKALGTELYVCGQFLAAEGLAPSALSADVSVASDALVVLITYQNRGYALLSF